MKSEVGVRRRELASAQEELLKMKGLRKKNSAQTSSEERTLGQQGRAMRGRMREAKESVAEGSLEWQAGRGQPPWESRLREGQKKRRAPVQARKGMKEEGGLARERAGMEEALVAWGEGCDRL